MNIFAIHGFDFPFILIAGSIVCIIGVYFFLTSQKKQNFGDLELIVSVYKKNTFLYKLYNISLLLISIYIILLLAEPYKNNETQQIQKNGIDIQIVFDMSYSMIAQDLKPSRLDVAKGVLGEFISGLQSDRVGLILFSGKPFQSIPLTFDYDFVKKFIGDLEINIIDQSNPELMGTALGDGIVLGAGILGKQDEEREKIMILITDGEANRGAEPELALKLLKDQNIKTYTIGVGKDEQTSVDVPLPSGFIQKVRIGGIDEEILQKISNETGGLYFRADSRESLSEILETISQLEKSEIVYEQYVYNIPARKGILLLLLIQLLFLVYLLLYKKIRH